MTIRGTVRVAICGVLSILAGCQVPSETRSSSGASKGSASSSSSGETSSFARAQTGQVMRVVGRQLLDSNGKPFLARGIEGWFGPNAQQNMPKLVDAIASQGFNAVRLQLLTSDLTRIEPLIQRFQSKGMVVYLVDSNMPDVTEWFGRTATKAMVERNKSNLIIDATIEEEGDAENEEVVTAWLADQKAAITQFRKWGYTQPLTIGTPNAGRYLRALLDHGQELVDHDPLHSLVLNAQMYWGAYSGGFSYQQLNGFSDGNKGVLEATAAVAKKPFLIQFGLDAQDSGGNWADVPYDLLMTEAQAKRIGTMFWQWKDPGENDPNSLVKNQFNAASLTPLGDIIINTHPASIRKTSKLVSLPGSTPVTPPVAQPGTPPPVVQPGTPPVTAPATPPVVAQPGNPQVMRVVGRQLLDSSGIPFIARGIEGWFGPNAQNNMPKLVDAIASQGFNSVRLQLLTSDLKKIEPLIQRFQSKGMVVYLVDSGMEPPVKDWFGQAATKAMVERNKFNLVIDATIEEEGDAESEDVVRAWLADQKAVITQFRKWGYTQPLTIGTPNAGRYLRALLDHGQELVDHDPLHSLVLNCQIYWGAYSGGFSYQQLNGFSAGNKGVLEATSAVAKKPFLIQFGLDAQDSGGNWADVPYELLMTEAHAKGIGTLWWEWKDPDESNPNSLVDDQFDAGSLTPLGNIVINTHPASIKKTSKLVTPIGASAAPPVAAPPVVTPPKPPVVTPPVVAPPKPPVVTPPVTAPPKPPVVTPPVVTPPPVTAPPVTPPVVVQPGAARVMRVVGKQLLDSSGLPFLVRGIEGWFGPNGQNNMPKLVDGIASQGFNAVRLQLLTDDLKKIEALIQRFHSKGMVVYLVDSSIQPPVKDWFGLAATKAMVERNKFNLVIDATIEEEGDGESAADVATWLREQKAVITQFRAWGYTQPLTIGTPNAGRYLRALLDHGQELVNHDPLHSLVLNCQIYWGAYSGDFSYQVLSGFAQGNAGIREATAAIAAKPFLIQLGLDAQDSGGSWADVPYDLLMTEVQAKGIGTMWWQWKDPGDNDPNSLVKDQLDPNSLTPLGKIVINTHPASIKKTSKLVKIIK